MTDAPPEQDPPVVSVITPCFNSARFITQTIASVQAQSCGAWEMLLADDVSSDNTREIIEALAAEDPRLRLIRREANGGPAAARNSALAEARGRYIAFLDHDDLWRPDKLSRQLAFMAETDCAISYTAYRRVSARDGKPGGLIRVPPTMTYDRLLKHTAIANLTAMIDQAKTGPIRVPEMPYDDYALWLSLLRKGFTARGLNEDLARFRVVEGSSSSRKHQAVAWVWRIYRHQERLSVVRALWCVAHYVGRAALKHLK
ncbi:MAG: glycosyltransferase family 2 protein [Pseudomonadota bacterium]